MTFGAIARRLAVYFGIAVAFLVIFALIFAASIHWHLSIQFPWLMLAIFTGFLTFAVVKTSREYWTQVYFWFVMAALLTIHVGAFIVVLRRYPDFKPIWL